MVRRPGEQVSTIPWEVFVSDLITTFGARAGERSPDPDLDLVWQCLQPHRGRGRWSGGAREEFKLHSPLCRITLGQCSTVVRSLQGYVRKQGLCVEQMRTWWISMQEGNPHLKPIIPLC